MVSICWWHDNQNSWLRSELISDHRSSINPHIQFTSEEEKNSGIPLLDTCLQVNEDGPMKVTVYRKPTHNDQYMNFHSNHHLQHKRAVVNTVLLRAQTLVCEEVDKVKEIRHVKQPLKANNYPDWMLTIPNIGSVSSVSEESLNEKRIYAKVPYIKSTLERLQRTFKSH